MPRLDGPPLGSTPASNAIVTYPFRDLAEAFSYDLGKTRATAAHQAAPSSRASASLSRLNSKFAPLIVPSALQHSASALADHPDAA